MNGMNTLLTSAMVSADVTELDTDLVTPGVLGFLVIFGIALVLYFLMRSMTGKLRTVSEQREAEQAAQDENAEDGAVEDEVADTGDQPAETGENAPTSSDGSEEQAKDTSR